MLRFRPLPFLVCSALITACSPPDAEVALPSPWDVRNEPLLRIGEFEGDPDYLLQDISGIRLLPDGRIAIADQGHGAIRVFDATGRIQATMGRPGQGPGEFTRLDAIWAVAPDTIRAFDGPNMQLTTFLADGSLVESRRLSVSSDALAEIPDLGQSPLTTPDFFLGAFDDGSVAVGWTRAGPRSSDSTAPDRLAFARFGSDGTLITDLGNGMGMRRFNGSPIPFSPFPHAVVYQDSLYFTDGVDQIEVRDSGGSVHRTIPIPNPSSDATEAWSRLDDAIQRQPDAYVGAIVDRLPDVPKTDLVPRASAFLIDDLGFIWTKTFDPVDDAIGVGDQRRGGGEWMVTDLNGERVARVTVPDGVEPVEIVGDRLLGIERDELGVQRVVIHEIERPDPAR